MTQLSALTRYNREIPKTFPDRRTAISWAASEDGQRYGVARIVQMTKNGLRTVWRVPVEEKAA